MKRNVLFAALMLAAGSLLAADLKDEVTSAAKKLADSDNYTWKQTVENAGGRGGGGGRRGGGFGGGPQEGKVQKDGLIFLSITRGDNTQEVVLKGKKGAVKTDEGWKTFEELSADDGGGGGGGNRGAMMARMLQNTKAPASAIQDILGKVKEVSKSDDAYAADLTEDGAKSLLSFGPPRGGGDGPEISDAKGSLKVWITDGVVTKYQLKVKGTISFNGNDRAVDRTTTIEIKDVGATKVSPPDEAMKKLS